MGTGLPPTSQLNQPTEWHPGALVTLTDIQFELMPVGSVSSRQQTNASYEPLERLDLKAVPSIIRSGQTVTLTLNYSGAETRHVYLESHTGNPAAEVSLASGEFQIESGDSVQTQARVRRKQISWLGGMFRIRFVAFTRDGLVASTEVTLRSRPRYELSLLLLILLIPYAVGTTLFAAGTSTSTPIPATITSTSSLTATSTSTSSATTTSTPTVTSSATATSTSSATATPTLTVTSSATSTNTPSRTSTSTATATATRTASLTATNTATLTLTATTDPTVWLSQCPQYVQKGWVYYIIQLGDTVFSLSGKAGISVALLQQINAIPNPNLITVGQKICIPPLPTLVPDVTVPPPQPDPTTQVPPPCNPAYAVSAKVTPNEASTVFVNFTVTNTGCDMQQSDTAILQSYSTGTTADITNKQSFKLSRNASQAMQILCSNDGKGHSTISFQSGRQNPLTVSCDVPGEPQLCPPEYTISAAVASAPGTGADGRVTFTVTNTGCNMLQQDTAVLTSFINTDFSTGIGVPTITNSKSFKMYYNAPPQKFQILCSTDGEGYTTITFKGGIHPEFRIACNP